MNGNVHGKADVQLAYEISDLCREKWDLLRFHKGFD